MTLFPGHALIREGLTCYDVDGNFVPAYSSSFGAWLTDLGRTEGYGKCQCGTTFGPGLSRAAVKRLHRAHKDDLLLGGPDSRTRAT